MKSLSVQFVRRTLARMKTLTFVDEEVLAAALPKILNVQDPKGLIDRVTAYLEGVAVRMKEAPAPTCAECGEELDAVGRGLARALSVSYQTILQDQRLKDRRSDHRYCSPKCRQKAYRKRVAAKTRPKKRSRHGDTSRITVERINRNDPYEP